MSLLRGSRRTRRTAHPPTRTLVLGGARSGKSAHAEQLAPQANGQVIYVATGGHRPGDPEWALRVAAHQARRPASWRTIETSDIAGVLRTAPAPATVLIDCLELWITAVLDDNAAWSLGEGDDRGAVAARVADRCDDLLAAWASHPGDVIVVSNEVGSGVVPAITSRRWFRDELGRLNARFAATSDRVVLLIAGVPLVVKGAALTGHTKTSRGRFGGKR